MALIHPKSFYIFNHQHKGDLYKAAMHDAGYRIVMAPVAQVVFIDIDNPGRVNKLHRTLSSGKARLFIYPHAARPGIAWDGLFQSNRYTCAQFVAAEGHIEIMRAYGYKKPLHVAGWAYCPLVDFRKVAEPRNILFGPIHPTRSNFLSDLDKKINKATYERLLKLVDNGHIKLTVRYMRGLDVNGLWPDPRVTFVNGATDLSFTEIDSCDLVVSHQTFAYIAIARGKPTLMMSEETPPRNGGSEETMKFVDSWDKYKDMLMYPLDILSVDDTMGLIRRACASDADIADWRRRIIGESFNGKNVVHVVESYL